MLQALGHGMPELLVTRKLAKRIGQKGWGHESLFNGKGSSRLCHRLSVGLLVSIR